MDDRQGKLVLKLARATLRNHFGLGETLTLDEPWLNEKRATFVTLKLHGELRGCIGTIEPHRSLEEDIRKNALAAAILDPRFEPLRAEDLAKIQIEVSVLSPLEPLDFKDEKDALQNIRPGEDGVVLECGERRATFLPQVWEDLPDPREFLKHLKQKAGLSPDDWSPEIRLWRYTCEKWKE